MKLGSARLASSGTAPRACTLWLRIDPETRLVAGRVADHTKIVLIVILLAMRDLPCRYRGRTEMSNRVRAAIAAVLTALALLMGAGSAFAVPGPKPVHDPKPPHNCHQAKTC